MIDKVIRRWLHLPWEDHESPRAYYEKFLASLSEFHGTTGYAAVRDILDARERVLWERFLGAKVEEIAEIHARAQEIVFLRTLLEVKTGESARRAAAAERDAERERLRGQQKLSSSVDVALANMHAPR